LAEVHVRRAEITRVDKEVQRQKRKTEVCTGNRLGFPNLTMIMHEGVEAGSK
jgi:hypothetical protein